ncbi:MAG: hypothetical protein A2Y78_00025 [Acidobacteria bacterium RBG_13_68_16]|nr:MAG: hypothetical protein A2Y78_00025 [Acidobacteria bacterium RBG_13_68_16]
MCGALGGLLRKAGWPKEAAGDLVRLWLDGHPGIDVRHGVDWALGAWERPPGEVSGSQVLAGLVGAELARLIEAGVMLPWRAGRALPSLGDAQPAGASAPEIPGWRVRRFADPEEPIEWSCEGLALAPSRGKISIIAGQPGAGKGPIADHLALCLATGSRAFGRYPSQAGPTLLLDFEGSRLTMRRLRRMASAMGLDPAELDQQLMIVDTSDCVDPLHEAWSSMLIEVVQRDRIRHVILDSYTTAMLGTAVEANSTAYAGLARLLGRLDCLVLCVAHATKAAAERAPRLADIGGTGALGALAQTAIFAHRPKDDDEHRIRVSCGRGPETRFAPFDVLFSDLEDGGLGLTAYDVPVEAAKTESGQPGVARPAHGTPVVEAGVRIWKFLRDSVTTHTRRELVDVGGGANRPAKAALALLVEAGVIQLLASHYGITPAGREKSQDDVVLALGLIGGAFGA